MLQKINPYGIGNNVYQQSPKQEVAAQEKTVQQAPAAIQDTQEISNLSSQELAIRKFSDGVKGANEMIGAMQIADITLNALSNQIRSGNGDLASLDSTAKAAQFKNDTLFGRELSVSLNDENVTLSLPLPSKLANNEADLAQSLTQKHEEISQKLGKISELIEKASLPFTQNTQNFDFENFDANTFKGLFS